MVRRNSLVTAGLLLAAVGAGGFALGLLGGLSPWLDMLNIARPLWIALALLGLAVVAWSRRWRPAAALAAIGVASAAWTLAPDRLPGVADCAAGSRLKIVQFNLSDQNPSPGRTAAWILAQNADVLLLQESKRGSAGVPASLTAAYPYAQACHPRVPCSTLVMTRQAPAEALPLARGDVENRQGLSAALVRLASPAGAIDIISVHLSRPWPPGRQRGEARALGRHLVASPLLIVGGDFNATAEMTVMARFAADLGLRFVSPRWPSWPQPALLGIDHILAGPGWRRLAAERGPGTGSDHSPQSVTLCRAASPPEALG